MLALARKIFGSSNERRVKGMKGRTAAIGAFEPAVQALSDDQLSAKTVEVYLSRVYRKLGVRSRVELAVAARAGSVGALERRELPTDAGGTRSAVVSQPAAVNTAATR